MRVKSKRSLRVVLQVRIQVLHNTLRETFCRWSPHLSETASPLEQEGAASQHPVGNGLVASRCFSRTAHTQEPMKRFFQGSSRHVPSFKASSHRFLCNIGPLFSSCTSWSASISETSPGLLKCVAFPRQPPVWYRDDPSRPSVEILRQLAFCTNRHYRPPHSSVNGTRRASKCSGKPALSERCQQNSCAGPSTNCRRQRLAPAGWISGSSVR